MRKQGGFTLIEIIVSLVLVGTMSAIAGMAIVTAMKGYVFSKDNATLSEKAQLALARINRELIEIIDVTSAESSRITYTRMSGDNIVAQTIYRSDNKIKIVAGANASGGDDLIDSVNNLTFSYFKGSASWVVGTDDINLLSAIQVTLLLARSDGGANLTFSTTASPRNNQNIGGEPPTTTPPARVGYGCFVATAAFGDIHHPMVQLLREFRDRFLVTWSGGKALVERYYTVGPRAAAAIQHRPWVRSLARMALWPMAALALLLLHCPAGVLTVLVGSWLITSITLIRRRNGRHPRPVNLSTPQDGSVLIGIVIVMTILAALGAAMLPLTTSSVQMQLSGSFSMRAYFLAESGYRYVGGEYLNADSETAKDNRLEALHTKILTLSNNDGKFQLYIYPYFFKTTADPVGTATLQAKVTGGIPPGLTLSSGYLKVNGVIHPYSGASQTSTTVTFTRSGGNWPAVPIGSTVHPVSRPSSNQTVNNSTHNYVDLETSTASINSFPLHNSTFKIDGSPVVYSYTKRNGNRLAGVQLADTSHPSFSVNITSGSNIVLEKFLKLRSIGTYSPGNDLQTSREILYHVPIGYAVSGGNATKVTHHENFNNMNNWFQGSGQGEVGGHEITTVDGDSALHVTSAASPALFGSTGQWSLLQFNWSGTNANLATAWEEAGNLLSYDLQVKVKATSQPYFMAGINFRTLSSGSDFYCYGISYMRARQIRYRLLGNWGSWNESSDIPSAIVPSALFVAPMETGSIQGSWFLGSQDRYSLPAIVLWQRTNSGFRWLAYKLLTTSDQVVANNASGWPRLLDWSQIQVRAIEAYPLPFTNGGPTPLLYGDIVTGESSGASAQLNGTPIVSSGNWANGNVAGKLTLSNVSGSFSSGENLLVGGVVRARSQGSLGSRQNFIRAYYGDTGAHGTANGVATDNNRLSNPRVTSSGATIHWPVDDIGAWAADNDYPTLVRWSDDQNEDLETPIVRLGADAELNAIIQTSALTTPDSGEFTRSEIALHTAGSSSSNIYFDDFAIQVPGVSGSSTGFLPPIQQ